jgi:D-alanyl-D-alanine carboxypeptidase
VANYYTPEVLSNMLERVKKRKEAGLDPMQVQNYTEFAPKELTTQYDATPMNMYKSTQEQIGANQQTIADTASIMAQNRYNQRLLQEQRQQVKAAQQQYVKPLKPGEVKANIPVQPGATGNYSAQTWGKNRIPQVGDIAQLNPNAGLQTMNFHGMNYTVNKQVAPIFQSFLTDLWRMGYHPVSIGGYANRNIAGTNTKSLHSLGYAIDIDPTKNPVNRDSNHADDVYALPASVGALAAKYGLSWGGSWNSYKDYMHFSVPYGGRQ